MNNLQEMYQEYAFIEPSEAGSVPATGLAGALPYILRTYEGCRWYYIVFKPFDRSYAKKPKWYLERGLEKCFKYILNPEFAIYTRERMDCAKVHINGLVCSRLILDLDGKNYCNKYRISCAELDTLGDRRRVLTYICKEEMESNPWEAFIDYRLKVH